MLFFLTTQPIWVSGTILIGLTTVLAMLGPYVVRRHVALERLTTNNEVAGFKFATVGVLYAVLLAFAIFVVWQRYADAETTVAQEAGAADTIYRLSYGIGEKSGGELRSALTNYLTIAIADDWPAMDRGTLAAKRPARHALNELCATLLSVESAQRDNAPLVSEILRQLDVITQSRRVRLVAEARARRHLAGSVRRRRFDDNVHLFLRRAQLARADGHDGVSFNAHLLGTLDHRRHQPAVLRNGQGATAGARRGAGGVQAGSQRRNRTGPAALMTAATLSAAAARQYDRSVTSRAIGTRT